MKLAWVSSWDRICGIADYSKELWPEVQKCLVDRGDHGQIISLDQFKTTKEILDTLEAFSPDIIHFQHEYGLYGGKNPPFYTFPRLVHEVKKKIPRASLVATAHTVLPTDHKFPIQGPLWQKPVRMGANIFLLKMLREYWGPLTWGTLDRGIVHSRLQVEPLKESQLENVEVIPHFVPNRETLKAREFKDRTIMVFGFFTREKGQDIVIDALSLIPQRERPKLIFAGGVRRSADQSYYEMCQSKISRLGLQDHVHILGYVKAEDMNTSLSQSSLMIAPFRQTTGSGSLAQLLARGLPVLASDLPLNVEINQRHPGTLDFFASEDSQSLALKISNLLNSQEKLTRMRQGALQYAAALSPTRVAYQHILAYDSLGPKT